MILNRSVGRYGVSKEALDAKISEEPETAVFELEDICPVDPDSSVALRSVTMRGDMVQFDDDAEAVLRRLGINPDVVSGEDMARLRVLAAEVASQVQRGEVSDEAIDPKLRRLIKLLSAASKSIH
jgi:hypothetical protein